MDPPKHVLINGAGLAALSLSLALAKRGIRSTVFEIRPGPATLGGAVTLAPNALRVLDKALGVADAVRKAGFEYEKLCLMADDGLQLGSFDIGSQERYGYSAVRISRSVLHGVLLDAAKTWPAHVGFHWDVQVEIIEERESGVKVVLRNGVSVEGDVLIGADGIHSKVRDYMLGELAPTPTYAGSFAVGGIVDRRDVVWAQFELPCVLFSRSGVLMAIPVDSSGGKVGWVIQRNIPERTRQGWHEYITSGQALQGCRDIIQDAGQVGSSLAFGA